MSQPARRRLRRTSRVAPQRRGQSTLGCLVILGVMALGAAAGVLYIRIHLHELSPLDTAIAAVDGAGAVCLGGLILAFLLALPVLLRQNPAFALTPLAALAAATVAMVLTLLVFHLPTNLSASIAGTSLFAVGIATYLGIKAPPGKRLSTFLSTFLKAMMSGGDD